MSLPRAGVSLVVENDKAFKDALSEVNAGLKVNKQQMQLVTEQTKEMDDRQAALKTAVRDRAADAPKLPRQG